jgi:hypothetical protein
MKVISAKPLFSPQLCLMPMRASLSVMSIIQRNGGLAG